ncbi:hypothetical protein FOA43_000767 [Brettanomyces nanus]|uniref:Sensitive to high expression protein 9, mitochondrial n=1 Tax=Eeniella nana TaxID=13502 RepID=A0A875RWX5_EENNA|nr:uncharacterized protein FOA43_000767 [Brettanomyces nanus]QPG73456.1 hypothetical protein FOA43_000767 [Brettanomyces nanus]
MIPFRPPPPPKGKESPSSSPNTAIPYISYRDRALRFVNSVVQGDNFKQLKEELAKFKKKRLEKPTDPDKTFSRKLDANVRELRSSISIASRVVNDLTGYTKVNRLKEMIAANEYKMRELRDHISAAKVAYNNAIEQRLQSQKEMNELLERKSSWTPTDLETFTKLYMNEHALEQEVQKRSTELNELEKKDDDTHDQLIKSIMDRYHEEQVWSDKIRQFSTWGTVIIMVGNLLLVLLVQLVFEPFKRFRLVNSFEKKVRDLFVKNEEMATEINSIRKDIRTSQEQLLFKVDETAGKHITASLLPSEFSWNSFSNWIGLVFGKVLSPVGSIGMDTFTVSKRDLQGFLYLFSTFMLALGCLLGHFI